MKIGIITMHRVPNYGSFLQTYATQFLINSLGHNCEIIDYEFPNEWQFSRGTLNNKSRFAQFKLFIVKVFLFLFKSNCGIRSIAENEKKIKIMKYSKKYYKLSKRHYKTYNSIRQNPPIYDLYMTGSDQTWNPQHIKGDSNFMLDFVPKGKKKVSFSASMSCNEVPSDMQYIYKRCLSDYNYISIREKNNISLIQGLSGKSDVKVTLDPTLMLNKEEWISSFMYDSLSIEIPDDNYIVFYMLSYSFNPQPYIYHLLKKLQDKTGCLVLSFTFINKEYNIKYKYIGNSGISDFIKVFSNASHIVTSSFHGTAFALNFGINLYSVVPHDYKKRDSRQVDLLEMVKADKCIIPIGMDLERINYTSDPAQKYLISKRLEDLRKDTYSWLNEALLNTSTVN